MCRLYSMQSLLLSRPSSPPGIHVLGSVVIPGRLLWRDELSSTVEAIVWAKGWPDLVAGLDFSWSMIDRRRWR